MNNIVTNLIISFVLLITINVAAQDYYNVPCNDKNIIVEGSNYVSIEDNELVAHRHNQKVYENTTKENLFNPLKARTCSGITLNFKTKSPTVKVRFKIIEGLDKAPVFGVFQDDVFDKNKQFKYIPNNIVTIDISSKKSGKHVTYSITFPLKTDVHFLGLELEENHNLEPLKRETRKTYVAFGDSISHGTGQQTTQETFPFILAKKLNYELFNTAVGGSKTSEVMAEMIRDDFKHIDMMTVLIGTNDFNGEGVGVEALKKRYENILNIIRETHKETKIYCIVSLATKWKTSKKTNLPIELFIAAITEIIKERQQKGDDNIYIIEGDKLTTIEDLKDNVHLSVAGAKSFAEELSKIIE
ncbi:hypothetical protein BWZ20_07930 [Winogradskyella sp. J14-2]|uniref:SGNH/GDSL hydrolase family protein n=1 Tax=Winogradskyella sp. J14-2 TaxID=1936080 RepID=UPI000972A903|nr:GDSL-type esterase/lipase family protein [Winogradskyella sp. J14-2]APY08234.1 hypothetical protein BWZ20_07930 [Winogradskyella sp. J14-2]